SQATCRPVPAASLPRPHSVVPPTRPAPSGGRGGQSTARTEPAGVTDERETTSDRWRRPATPRRLLSPVVASCRPFSRHAFPVLRGGARPMQRLMLFSGLCLLLACSDASDTMAVDNAAPWRQPGDVIDSILPMAEHERRFREGLSEVDA